MNAANCVSHFQNWLESDWLSTKDRIFYKFNFYTNANQSTKWGENNFLGKIFKPKMFISVLLTVNLHQNEKNQQFLLPNLDMFALMERCFLVCSMNEFVVVIIIGFLYHIRCVGEMFIQFRSQPLKWFICM